MKTSQLTTLTAPARMLSLAGICLLCLAGTVHAATINWTNTAGGNWNTAANWSPNQVPGAADSAVITVAGTYTVTLDVNPTVAGLTLGASSGVQTLSASSRTLTLNGASAINANGVMTLNNSTVAGTGTLTSLGTFNDNNSTINADLVNQGLLVFRGNGNNLGGFFVNQAGATVRVLGDGSFSSAQVTVAAGFTNGGLIELTSVVNAQAVTLNVSSGSLVNAPGGVINVLAGTGGTRTINGQLDNRGTVTVDQALTLSGASADHLNSGTITLAGGDLTVSQGGTTPSFTTTGTITIGAGRTFTVSAGTFNYNAGTVGGTGTLSLSSTVANFTPDFSNATTTLRLNGATLNGPGTVTNAVTGTLNTDNSTINADLVNQGLLVFRGNGNNLGGFFVNQAGATVRVLGDGSFSSAQVTVAAGFTNGGLIELTSVVNAQAVTLNVSSGSLVNAPGGQINVLAGTGGTRALNGQLDNRGTVTVDQALTLSGASADHLNSGTITLAGGDLTVSQGGTTPSFTTTGTIDIASGRTFLVSGGTMNNVAPGIIQGAGFLNVNATLFSNAGNVNPGSSPAVLTVIGDFPQTDAGALNIELGGLATGTQFDRLAVSNDVTLGGSLQVSFINGFQSAVTSGDTFTVLTANVSLTGAFTNVASGQRVFTTDGIGSFVATYSGASRTVVLSAFAPVGGVVADFTAGPVSGQAPLLVNFTNLTAGSATSFLWNFGDGGNSTESNPVHLYTIAGSYTVSLTATGPGGTNTQTKPSFITVTNPPPVLVACVFTPPFATNVVGATQTSTNTVTQNGSAAAGVTVIFTVTNGPNAGLRGTNTTDVNGRATFGYASATVGTDILTATGSVSGVAFVCVATNVWVSGNVAPDITCPGNATFSTAAGQCSRSVTFSPVATGLPAPSVTCRIGSLVITSPHTFPLGTSTVTCTASNVAGLDTCSFDVGISDQTPPSIACPVDKVVPATAGTNNAVVTYTTPAATDNCGGATVVCAPPSGSTFPIGTTTVTCTATDGALNSTNCTFAVTVQEQVAETHDLAITKIKAPKNINLDSAPPAHTKRVIVTLQNRSAHSEVITNQAQLAALLRLEVHSLDTNECADIVPVLLEGPPQKKFPITLKAKAKLNVFFDVTFNCAVDPEKTTRNEDHADFSYVARVYHEALDGVADTHPECDVCPRGPQPDNHDPNPNGKIVDKGCGAPAGGGGILGNPVLTDVFMK